MQVDEMEAGRELDALVAERVMGAVPAHTPGDWMVAVGAPPYYRFGGSVRGLPDYSTNIAAAWQVVERMSEQALPCVMHDGQMWVGEFYCITYSHTAYAHTAPLAICRVALKAVGVEVQP